MDDVEIHTTSAFSFLRGGSLPEDLVETAASLGYGAVALLDRDGLQGAPRFYRAARAHGLRAIVGAVLSVAYARAGGPGPTARGVLGLYVQSAAGYRNLCRLITTARMRASKLDAREDRITVSLDELAAHRDGLAAVLLAGEAPLAGLPRSAAQSLVFARAIAGVFGADRCFVELVHTLTRPGARVAARLVELAQSLGLELVASNDVRYARREDRALADVLACARSHTTLDTAGRILLPNAERHLKPPGALRELFRAQPRALDAARAFAASCDFTLEHLGYRLPDYPLAPGETAQGVLEQLAYAGARERFRDVAIGTSLAQIARELALIAHLGFAGYFLIVHDLVRFCRERGILVQGRGSAANSAVCYALGITAVDPVRGELLFERFLSEARGEWPDIDLDLPSGERREEVIQYVYRRYGERGAAMTANVVTYRARSAVRECGKALGFPEDVLAKLSKHLSWGSLDREGLAERVASTGLSLDDARVALLIDTSFRLQNLPRHLGQHSGGMVIAAGRLDEICPLEPAAMPGRVIVQWDKDDCGDLGILKVDLLGLGMMALLEDVVPMIRTHDGVDLDLAQLPEDDPATYKMLREADTVGVFQVESRAQMATLPRLRPERFYDLVVEVAIIRPGPIVGKMVNPYLERRQKRVPVTYPHPSLEPILERTLGVPLFQEQLMRVAMEAAGFTGSEAEELRRAMGSKRSVEKMAALEQKLRDGMRARGYTRAAEDEVVQGISAFALYGFPESHAISFALLAYASAYIKRHHAASFTCALLDNWPMGFYHPSTVIQDAQRHGVRVLPVDVTRSDWRCTREGPAVRLGLRYVRGLRESLGVAIERARPFSSIDDLARRAGVRRAELETLAELGALVAVPRRSRDARWTRRSALWQVQAVAARPPGELFARSDAAEDDSPLAEMSPSERIAADYRASGVTVGRHPLALRRGELTARGILRVSDFLDARDGDAVAVAGAVITRQRPGTAKGFFFMTLEDETGIANAIIHPKLFAAQRATMVAEPLVVLHGVVQKQQGVTSLKVAFAEPLAARGDEAVMPGGHDFR